MIRLLAVLLVLSACKRNGTDDDTDDTGIEPLVPTFIGFTQRESDAERRGESLQVALVHVTVEASGEWTLGEQLAIAPLTGTGNFGVELPEQAPDGDIGTIDGGTAGAMYLPIILDDVDRDGLYVEADNDFVLGYAESLWLVWLDAPAGGQEAGWAVIDRSGDTPAFRPLTSQSVVDLWGLSSEPRLTGTLNVGEQRLGVASRDVRHFDGGEASAFVAWSAVSNATTGRFETTVTLRPSADAFQFPEGSVRRAVMAQQLFVDVDENGAYTPGTDTLLDKGLCYEGSRLEARFVDTPRTVAVARVLARDRLTSGWRFVVDGEELNTTSLRFIPFGDGCDL